MLVVSIVMYFALHCILSNDIFAGPNARERRASVHIDHDCWDTGLFYTGQIAAGETKAIMVVYALAPNVTRMLETSAWIDSEPAELFHDLTADQLSQIVNWGGCQSILGPDVTVTVTPPSSCSSGATSDFTVSATSTRGKFHYSQVMGDLTYFFQRDYQVVSSIAL
jgi:hypothetical protein